MPLNLESQVLLNHDDLDYLYNLGMSIGARIKQLRLSNNLSGEKFGDMCGLTKGAISQWEHDDVTPPIDRLIELKKHLDFSIDWIYTGEISPAEEIARSLSVKERAAWYRIGHTLTEQDDGTNDGKK